MKFRIVLFLLWDLNLYIFLLHIFEILPNDFTVHKKNLYFITFLQLHMENYKWF